MWPSMVSAPMPGTLAVTLALLAEVVLVEAEAGEEAEAKMSMEQVWVSRCVVDSTLRVASIYVTIIENAR